MKHVTLILRVLLISLAGYLLWFLGFEYYPADPLGYQPPFVLWVIDTINLFIHEAGHLFCKMFGETMYVLGGSVVQCALPLAIAIVTWREKPHQLGYPLFWFGEWVF